MGCGIRACVNPDIYHAWRDGRFRPFTPLLSRRAALARQYEVVGPVCESGDFLGHARDLAIEQGDMLVLMSAGAYGMSMSSNYNTRPRAAEIMVDGAEVKLIREREKVEQLFAGEKNYL